MPQKILISGPQTGFDVETLPLILALMQYHVCYDNGLKGDADTANVSLPHGGSLVHEKD